MKITYPSQIHLIENAKNDIFDYMKVENNRKCPTLHGSNLEIGWFVGVS